VKSVTIDLGAVKEVGEVRTRCSCSVTASDDGATWRKLPASGEYGKPKSMRYVSVSGTSIGSVPEVSVWAPWPDVAATPLGPGDAPPIGGVGQPDSSDGGNGTPWLPGAIALAALFAVASTALNRLKAR
jgi:hypothetical protein